MLPHQTPKELISSFWDSLLVTAILVVFWGTCTVLADLVLATVSGSRCEVVLRSRERSDLFMKELRNDRKIVPLRLLPNGQHLLS